MLPTVTRRDPTASHAFCQGAASLALERQLVVPAPLVPGAGVVARVVAGGTERGGRGRRAGAGVAVRDDLRPLGQTDELTDSLGRSRSARPLEELADVEVPRARDVPLARVALVAAAAYVLVRRPHVEDRQRRIGEPGRQLLPRRECLRIRLEVGPRLPHRLQLD